MCHWFISTTLSRLCYVSHTGYVQGMSDLLSPILYVMNNEVDAFWCFVGFMDRVVCIRQHGIRLGNMVLDWAGLYCIGSGRTVLYWIGQDCIVLDRAGLYCIGFEIS